MAHLVGTPALPGSAPRSRSSGRLAIPARLPVLTVGSGAGPGVVALHVPAAGQAGASTRPRPELSSGASSQRSTGVPRLPMRASGEPAGRTPGTPAGSVSYTHLTLPTKRIV